MMPEFQSGRANRPLRLAVLVSGSGSTLQNLIDRIAAGSLAASIGVVVGSRPGLKGIERAAAAGLTNHVVDRTAISPAGFSAQVFAHCDDAHADLICMAGWLSLLEIPPQYAGRVMNIHPALLPSFGGRGMYGARVHRAVIDHGCKISGCTVHFVDGDYDNGPIILQRACAVAENDTPDTLAARIFGEECQAYPEAIALFAAGRLRLQGRRVNVLPL